MNRSTLSSVRRVISARQLALACAGLLALPALSGCYTFVKAPGSADLEQVVNAVESVLKERYYQTRVHRSSGHAFAFSQVELEGAYPVMYRIDVHIVPERTGHYMPRVFARKYMDIAEPPFESGDQFTHYDVEGNPFATQNWKPII